MGLPEVRMSFPDRVAFERELETNLKHGRAFLKQANDVAVLSECVLVLVHPEHQQELRLCAQVVMVNDSGPACGMGIALRSFGPNDLAELQAFVDSRPANTTEAPEETREEVGEREPAPAVHGVRDAAIGGEAAAEDAATVSGGDALPSTSRSADPLPVPAADTLAHELAEQTVPVTEQTVARAGAGEDSELPAIVAEAVDALGIVQAVTETASAILERDPVAPSTLAADGGETLVPEDAASETTAHQDADGEDEGCDLAEHELLEAEQLALGTEEELALEGGGRSSELQREQRQQKLRTLNPGQQQKLARTGELADRIAIERLYGKAVWEALLHNPRLSIPEVARIARKGTVPRPLLDFILDNGNWTKQTTVRRALLSNPKLSSDGVLKLLRATAKHELKLIEKGTAYGPSVREAARKLLRQQG